MTPTERLRELLDERHEPWVGEDDTTTEWALGYDPHMAVEDIMDTLQVTGLTPEMAVDATLGRESCCISGNECDQCGAFIHERAVTYWVPVGNGIETAERHDVHYCPNCGRKVVQV